MRGGYSRNEEREEAEPLPGQGRKPLPKGVWMFVHQLPADATDIELQEFLAGIGITLPLEAISITPAKNYLSCGLVSLPDETVAMLVNWAINNALFRGKSLVEFKGPKRKVT